MAGDSPPHIRASLVPDWVSDDGDSPNLTPLEDGDKGPDRYADCEPNQCCAPPVGAYLRRLLPYLWTAAGVSAMAGGAYALRLCDEWEKTILSYNGAEAARDERLQLAQFVERVLFFALKGEILEVKGEWVQAYGVAVELKALYEAHPRWVDAGDVDEARRDMARLESIRSRGSPVAAVPLVRAAMSRQDIEAVRFIRHCEALFPRQALANEKVRIGFERLKTQNDERELPSALRLAFLMEIATSNLHPLNERNIPDLAFLLRTRLETRLPRSSGRQALEARAYLETLRTALERFVMLQ